MDIVSELQKCALAEMNEGTEYVLEEAAKEIVRLQDKLINANNKLIAANNETLRRGQVVLQSIIDLRHATE